MKRTLIIIGICCFLFTTKINCQVTSNIYEVEIDKLLAKKNPNYYDGLARVLSEFEKGLISKGIIVDGTYQSYVSLLKQISKDDKMEFEIEYDLKQALEGLGEGITKIIPSIETSLISQKYLNIENSKGSLFNNKVSELFQNGKELNRSIFSELILDTYGEDDFQLPLIKLKILRFLDPNSDSIMYIYAGRPYPE
ncbi:hypothetical protein [Sediminicola sp. 1XM1-17]|uniref:hypothetical protein n=1 Tax=Sediminicola sp. 1XM1-17 TaxID=3127702 RepID=UPI0030770F0E